MISVPQSVEKIIKEVPFLEEGLSSGLINLSSLARRIKKQVEDMAKKPVKEGTIIMALKRLSSKIQPKTQSLKNGFEKETDITIRSNLFEATYPVSQEILEKQEELFRKISKKKGLFFTITQSMYEITIIGSQKVKEEVDKTLTIKPVSSFTGLSALTIHLSRRATETPGLFYYLIKTLAWENISIVEVVSTFTEFSFILKNEDVARAFNSLRESLKFS